MTTALALASVTALLKDLLENGLASGDITSQIGGDATVSALPPDRIASGADERAQLNLFLYHVTPRTAMRTSERRADVRALVLELHYLISAYGAQDLQTEILLGHALQLLNATPVLDRKAIRDTLKALSHSRDKRVVPPPLASLARSDLSERVDQLKIEPEFLSGEESSKLWSALQAKYRPSATYKVSAVLIDGARGDGARGDGGRGDGARAK
jgi:hypothetical protein